MTKLSRSIVCAVLVFGASTAPAASVAPNVQVNVKQGRTRLFTGVTDASGRFTTTPLQPGVYTFELRALKTAPPAQYFLLLSGAKPVTTAMADKKAVLMMDAQVRTLREVRGQVTARRITVAAAAQNAAGAVGTPTSPAASGSGPSAPVMRQPPAAPQTAARTTARPAAAPAAVPPGLSPRPATSEPRMINGRPHDWVPIAPGSNLGRWLPTRGAQRSAAPATTAQPTPKPRSSPAPRR